MAREEISNGNKAFTGEEPSYARMRFLISGLVVIPSSSHLSHMANLAFNIKKYKLYVHLNVINPFILYIHERRNNGL